MERLSKPSHHEGRTRRIAELKMQDYTVRRTLGEVEREAYEREWRPLWDAAREPVNEPAVERHVAPSAMWRQVGWRKGEE